jgi:hypothetical protein
VAELSRKLVDLVDSDPLSHLATASANGIPDVAPLTMPSSADIHTIVVSAISRVTAAQIKGKATILTSGDRHEQARRRTVEALGPEARDSFDGTTVLKVDEMHSMLAGAHLHHNRAHPE